MKMAKQQYKKSLFSVHFMATSAMAVGVLSTAMTAHAAPVLDHVVAGGVTVDNVTGVGNVTVTQTTNQGVVNWNNFNIAPTETTQFVQPSANSVTLNRVTGDANPSQIMGTLNANGKVAIVNPNGIVFGKNSKVDVAGLVATTADIDSDAFMAGSTHFNQYGADNASVVNKGSITAQDGGLVALVAPNVKNSGVITARQGTVLLGGAKGATIDLYGDGLVNFAIEGESGGNNAVDVTTSGKIIADGGFVHIEANQASTVVDQVINMQGYVQADSLVEASGDIVIGNIEVDSKNGNALVGGTLQASGATSKGGDITINGKKVTVNESASLDVSGAEQGGKITVKSEDLVFGGTVDATGAKGGTVTFDPASIYLNDGGFNGKVNNLSETLVESISQSGAHVVVEAEDKVQLGNLSDDALTGGNGDITFKTISNVGKVIFSDKKDSIETTGGDIHLTAASGGIDVGSLSTKKGDVFLKTTHGGDISAKNLSVTHGDKKATVSALSDGSIDVNNVIVHVSDASGESSVVLHAKHDVHVKRDVEVIAKAGAGGVATDDVIAHIDIDAGKTITVGNDLRSFAENENAPGVASSQNTVAIIDLHAGKSIDLDHTEAHAYGGSDATSHVNMTSPLIAVRDDVESHAINNATTGGSQQGYIDILGQVTAYVKDYVTDFEATTDVVIDGDVRGVSTSDADVGLPKVIDANQAVRIIAGNLAQVTGTMSSLLADLVVRAGTGGVDIGDVSTGQDISGLVLNQEEGAFEAGSIDLRTAKGSGGDIKAGLLSVMGTAKDTAVTVSADGSATLSGINAQVLDYPDPGSQDTLHISVRAEKDVTINGDVLAKAMDDQGRTRNASVDVKIKAGNALAIGGDVLADAVAGNRGKKGDTGSSQAHVELAAGTALTVGDVLVKAFGGDTANARTTIVSGGTVAVGDMRVESASATGEANSYLGIVAAGTEAEDDSQITYNGAIPFASANSATLTSRYDAVDVQSDGRAEISIVAKPSSSGGSSSGGSSSGGSSSGGSSSGGSSSGGSSSGGSSSGGSSSSGGGSSSGGSSSGGVVPVPPSSNRSPFGLNALSILIDPDFQKNLYSFFGETIGNPYYYGNTDVNLTLLSGNRKSGAVTAPNIANLSAESLGAIAPAAGGASGEGDCGNNYLDAGFSTGFNNTTCREEAL